MKKRDGKEKKKDLIIYLITSFFLGHYISMAGALHAFWEDLVSKLALQYPRAYWMVCNGSHWSHSSSLHSVFDTKLLPLHHLANME